jgi:uncharacterized membrane protein YqaE (UPF0057 family)
MRLLLCYLCPPAAVLLCGRPFSMVMNCILTLWFWLPGVRHALVVYADWKAETTHQSMLAPTHTPQWFRTLAKAQATPQQVVYVQQPMALPEPAPAAPKSRGKQPAPPLINDPCVGAHGTVFRRK